MSVLSATTKENFSTGIPTHKYDEINMFCGKGPGRKRLGGVAQEDLRCCTKRIASVVLQSVEPVKGPSGFGCVSSVCVCGPRDIQTSVVRVSVRYRFQARDRTAFPRPPHTWCERLGGS